jgi:hypothetical protein
MRVIKNMSAEVPDTNGFYFRLDELSDDSKNNLYNGYDAIHTNFTPGDRQALLNIWMPTEFAQFKDHHGLNAVEYNKNAQEVYGVCPLTTEWLNRIDPEREYKYIFYPFNAKDIPEPKEKKYDVCYFGGIHSNLHAEMLNTITHYNYRYMTMTHGINRNTQEMLPLATDLNLTHNEKIDKVAECKVSVCYNIVPAEPRHIAAIKTYPEWETNPAFTDVESYGAFPQFKSRMHEAAISRTLNLVFRDPWRVTEDYYTPDEDFIYFDSQQELKVKLDEILNNWDSYSFMLDNAYNKAQNYTTEKMMDIIDNKKSWNSNFVDLAAHQS